MINKDLAKKALSFLKDSRRSLVLGHLKPDGDAISSIIAISLILKKLKKESYAFSEGKASDLFNYLKGFDSIHSNFFELKKDLNIKNNLIEFFDLIIVLDCGSLARTAIVDDILKFKEQGGKIIEFDHHPKIDNYADIELREASLASTTELIYYFIKENKIEFDQDLAEAILTGILTDTGNLLYPSANESTLKVVSKTLLAGARYNKLLTYTAQAKDSYTMKLWGFVLNNLKINRKYNIAISVVSRKDLENILGNKELDPGLESELFSGLAGFLSNLKEAKAVLLLYEGANGFIKGSLRSTSSGYRVDKLARALGGGGHKRASGFGIKGNLERLGTNWKLVDSDLRV